MGEDDGADVAAFHDDVALRAERLLQRTSQRRMGGWTLTSDAAAVICGVRSCSVTSAPIEQDAIAIRAGFEAHLRGVGERFERGGVAGGDAGVERLEGEGAVHGAAFEIEQAEALGESAGDGALPGTGGTIDGNDERGNGERLASLI